MTRNGSRRQGIFWIGTLPFGTAAQSFLPMQSLPEGIAWIRGQQEIGDGGYHHWQFLVAFTKKKSLAAAKEVCGRECHLELTVSRKAADYVWKEDTRVAGTQFEFGVKPFDRSSKEDWEEVWQSLTQRGDILSVPADLRIRCYRSIRTIVSDYRPAEAVVRQCYCFFGPTATGKSRRAWEEAGLEAFPKDPCSKFWDGYNGQEHVVIDEFRGAIHISHMLRWTDRYPVRVEPKGSSYPLRAKKIWITSNLHPRDWYPDLDYVTLSALMRRMEIIEFTE